MTTPFKAPDYAGNKPAGYIISNTKDMARWLGIQMGIVQDIPEIFHTVIEKSHRVICLFRLSTVCIMRQVGP